MSLSFWIMAAHSLGMLLKRLPKKTVVTPILFSGLIKWRLNGISSTNVSSSTNTTKVGVLGSSLDKVASRSSINSSRLENSVLASSLFVATYLCFLSLLQTCGRSFAHCKSFIIEALYTRTSLTSSDECNAIIFVTITLKMSATEPTTPTTFLSFKDMVIGTLVIFAYLFFNAIALSSIGSSSRVNPLFGD